MSPQILKDDFLSWIAFLAKYFKSKARTFGFNFEQKKDVVVSFLMAKRGRYSRPFLNLSLSVIVFTGVVGAPIVASTYPSVASQDLSDYNPSSQVISALSQEDFATTTEISDKPRNKVITYIVVPGDTLSSVAEKFGVSTDSIQWANNMADDKIVVDAPVKIPPVTGVVHKVKQGETVYSIAKKYQTDAQKIVNFPFNDFEDLDTFALAVGQTLIVPDGTPPTETPVAPRIAPQYIAGSGTGQFIWPTSGSVTQYPVWYHMAVDIANRDAPNVFAADSGVVVLSEKQRYGYGWHVLVDHGNGFQTLYAHLQRIDLSVGDKVTKGASIIGRMGSTGRSTGTHLHFEVRKGGIAVNPLGYLK
ncbi:M23 family metallopeptidase [Candidatus Gottesmanbacteria bacterium]|nr:M23 family metallopeptidase [Candidatus Gottesmanbacteria bacterium]